MKVNKAKVFLKERKARKDAQKELEQLVEKAALTGVRFLPEHENSDEKAENNVRKTYFKQTIALKRFFILFGST